MEIPDKPKYMVMDIETTGFRPWYGDRITCICAKDSDGNTFGRVNLNEWRIIGKFLDWLEERKPSNYFLVTKNGKEFDTGFILSRVAVKEMEMLPFAKILLAYKHFDLQDITSRHIGLQQMAELLGCASKSGDGAEAIKLWRKGKYKELRQYCMQDVDTTDEVFLKWLNLRDPHQCKLIAGKTASEALR